MVNNRETTACQNNCINNNYAFYVLQSCFLYFSFETILKIYPYSIPSLEAILIRSHPYRPSLFDPLEPSLVDPLRSNKDGLVFTHNCACRTENSFFELQNRTDYSGVLSFILSCNIFVELQKRWLLSLD